MAGYSRTPLATKLGLKPGQRVAFSGAPAGFREILEPFPDGVVWRRSLAPPLDLIVMFADRAATLERTLARAVGALAPAGMLWIAWPKKASKVATDLTEDRVRVFGLAAGVVDVKVCAITDVWSGLKFVRRLRDR